MLWTSWFSGVQIDVKGAKSDLHSGLYGGGVQNAIHALVELLASFRDKEGTILLKVFTTMCVR